MSENDEVMVYRVSNLKLSFSFRLVWTYGWSYIFGLLLCYSTDLRQFFGVKKPHRKWPEMTKNGIFSKNSIFKLILNFFFGRVFFGFWKILYKYFILNTPETFFWYVQGEEVEFIRTNSTSAPCIYQKTTQIRAKTGHLKKSMK